MADQARRRVTVLEQAASSQGVGRWKADAMLRSIGIDPDMDLEQFTRWLDLGRRYEACGAIGFVKNAPPEQKERPPA